MEGREWEEKKDEAEGEGEREGRRIEKAGGMLPLN
jgi:hypothetical protein